MIVKHNLPLPANATLSVPRCETADGLEIAEAIEEIACLLKNGDFHSVEMSCLRFGDPLDAESTVIELVVHHR
jgi:hypothetical protein